MNRLKTFLIVAATLVVTAARASKNHHDIVITIDGFPAYEFEDPKTPVPVLRKLAAGGVTGKGMKISNPAVTWPNHTTIVTGVRPEKHSVLFNGALVRPGDDKPAFINGQLDKDDLVKAKTVYDFLHERGYRTAGINWPCTRNAKMLDDNFPDVPQMIRHTTPRLIEELVRGGEMKVGSDLWFGTKAGKDRDEIWTAAACNSIKRLKPNILFFHLLVVDGVQHRFGPQSPEAYEALGQADKNVQKILDAVDAAGLRDNTTIFIVADHGFDKVEKWIHANAVLRNAGLLEARDDDSISRARVQAVPEGGTAFVYLNSAKTTDADRLKVISLLEKLEGVSKIVLPTDYAKLGLPQPVVNPQAPDLVLVAESGYSFANGTGGETISKKDRTTGSHGYLAENPKMNALFIVAGRGIEPGRKIDLVENIDIASTAAFLLGETYPHGDGKILKQIFTDKFLSDEQK